MCEECTQNEFQTYVQDDNGVKVQWVCEGIACRDCPKCRTKPCTNCGSNRAPGSTSNTETCCTTLGQQAPTCGPNWVPESTWQEKRDCTQSGLCAWVACIKCKYKAPEYLAPSPPPPPPPTT